MLNRAHTHASTNEHAYVHTHTQTAILTCSTELAKNVRKIAPNGPSLLLAGLNTGMYICGHLKSCYFNEDMAQRLHCKYTMLSKSAGLLLDTSDNRQWYCTFT